MPLYTTENRMVMGHAPRGLGDMIDFSQPLQVDPLLLLAGLAVLILASPISRGHRAARRAYSGYKRRKKSRAEINRQLEELKSQKRALGWL